MVVGCSVWKDCATGFLKGVTLYLVNGDVLENRYTKDCDWRDQGSHCIFETLAKGILDWLHTARYDRSG